MASMATRNASKNEKQVMPQDIHKWKHWACSHAGKVGSKKKNYTCGHSVITCPKCERKSKDDCPLPVCCSKKSATSASPAKKKSVVQKQGQPESSSNNLFYLILPPEVEEGVDIDNIDSSEQEEPSCTLQ